MPRAESTAEHALLVVHSGDTSHAIPPGQGVVTIGRDAQADVRIEDLPIAAEHLQAEAVDGSWRIVDTGPNGMFVDGQRTSSVTVTDKTTVRLGDPATGELLTFEVVKPSTADGRPGAQRPGAGEPDPGMARAGAAAAARRRELGISQRSLAADGIINAGALIAFEKGRSWPRERTQAKLEQVLQWPEGTIARIRRGQQDAGEAITRDGAAEAAKAPTQTTQSDAPASLIAQAIVAAVDGCVLAIAALPAADDPEFTERATPILADLRQLEAIAVRATRISRITPELIKALGTVRRHYDQLMTLGATAPGAPLAQRLYAARRRANLSPGETAEAAGVTEEMIVRAEADEAVPAAVADAIETLIGHIH
ncbi:FHA domain-containing protein [Mycobacterium seoulense]|uniref:ESX-1 type VII secretion system transcriptional regulator EspM n=1 Tax=Mycobacterium seoulense TaxID=386911 RepID=UPI003CF10CD8